MWGALSGVLNFFTMIFGWFERRRIRKEIEVLVEAGYQKEEARAAHIAAQKFAEHRSLDDDVERLHGGKF